MSEWLNQGETMKIYQKTALVLFLIASVAGCGDKKTAPSKPTQSKPTKEQVEKALVACQQGFQKYTLDSDSSDQEYLKAIKAFQPIGEKQCAVAAKAGQQQAYIPYAYYQGMLANGFFNMTVQDLEKWQRNKLAWIFSQSACHWAMKSLFASKFDDSQVKGDYQAFVISFLKKNGPDLAKTLGPSGKPRIERAVSLCGSDVESSIEQKASGSEPIIVSGGSGTVTTPKTSSPKQPTKEQVEKALLDCQQGFQKLSGVMSLNSSAQDELNAIKAFQSIGKNQCKVAANAGKQDAYLPYANYQNMLTNNAFTMTVKEYEQMKKSKPQFSQLACHWGMRYLWPNPKKFDDSNVKENYQAFVIDFLKKHAAELEKTFGKGESINAQMAVSMCGPDVMKAMRNK
jgi:hypothetical protein